MFKCLGLFFITLCFITTSFAGAPTGLYLQTRASQSAMTPEMALSKLQVGNERFLTGHLRPYPYLDLAKISHLGQYPFAIVLSCIDSRSGPEIVFDQGLGNIFTTSTAGNVVDTDVLGGMEYAVKYAGSKLIVIMGHTSCGAVGAACQGGDYSYNLSALLRQIQPAVSTIDRSNQGELSCKDPRTVNNIAKQNVMNQIAIVLDKSPAIRELLNSRKIGIVGAMHNITTGQVVFFDGDGIEIE